MKSRGLTKRVEQTETNIQHAGLICATDTVNEIPITVYRLMLSFL